MLVEITAEKQIMYIAVVQIIFMNTSLCLVSKFYSMYNLYRKHGRPRREGSYLHKQMNLVAEYILNLSFLIA